MPNPQPVDVHIDQYLTNISVGYKNLSYIADQIFPIVPVAKQSGIIPITDQSPFFRDEAQMRAPGTRSVGGGFTTTTDTFFAHRYSYRTELDDETRAQADANWNLERQLTELATDKIFMRREVQFAADFFKTGVWADDEVGGTDFTPWDDYAFGTPLVNLTDYQDEVEGRIVNEANTIVMGKAVWNKLRWHPDLVEAIKYTQVGIPGIDLISQATGINKILVGRSLYTTDPEGTAEASVTYSRIWGNDVLLLYVPDSPSLMTPAAGYTLTWARVPNSLNFVKRYRDDERETDIFEANTYFDAKALVTRAGTFLSNAVA